MKRNSPLLHPRGYGPESKFKRPVGNAVFTQFLDGNYNPQKAFVYKRKKIVRKDDPLPEVFKWSHHTQTREMRPKSASFVVGRRRRHTLRNATPTDSPYIVLHEQRLAK